MTDESIFAAALDIPDPAARAAYLDRVCAGDPALRGDVDGLLAAYAAANPLDAPPGLGTRAFVAVPEPDPTVPGDTVGPYKLLENIGHGGMGEVWLAAQAEPVKRRVAVKLIKAGMDSKRVLARFEGERQALAMMDHPNIAKVFDAGAAANGRPYFVMELVKGVPITAYCDARKLTPRERLELFVPVCQAIQHAHQKGIIHRDIKPSNVLVALYDDRPVPKVIDFGVSKSTGAALGSDTAGTEFGAVVGTVLYMSPEQATLNNLDIDTRSDVYSLGVLLYELLTGSPPFGREELEKRGLLEVLRIVREEEPPRPSAKLSTADTLPTLSANRGTEPKKLTGLLRNDLDWIVMKALEKDRARRYETATGFAADVNRYLTGEAVLAHPPSLAYRLTKAYRRNRTIVHAATLIVVLLVLGVVGTAAGLLRASAAEKQVLAEQTHRLQEGQQAWIKLASFGLSQPDVQQVLAEMAKAEDAGVVLPLELRLARAQANYAIGQEDEASREADELVRADVPQAVRCQALMVQAYVHIFRDFGRAEASLREAERGPLSPAERAYVRGLREERSEAALAAFREATAEDYRHLPARQMEVLVAFLLGRTGEAAAAAREALALAPRNPTSRVLSKYLLPAGGSREPDEREFFRDFDAIRRHPLGMFVVFHRLLAVVDRSERDANLNEITGFLGRLSKESGGFRPDGLQPWKEGALPPCLRASARLADLLAPGGQILRGESLEHPDRLLERAKIPQRTLTASELETVRRDLTLHPEGTSRFHYGHALFQRAHSQDRGNLPADTDLPRAYREAARAFEQAAREPMMIDLRVEALNCAAMGYGMAAQVTEDTRGTEPAKPDWVQGGKVVLERFQKYGTSGDSTRLSVLTAVALYGGHPAVAKVFWDEWQRGSPDRRESWIRLAQIEDKLNNPVAAREAALAYLAVSGNDHRKPGVMDILNRSNASLARLGAREMPPPVPMK